MAHPLAKAGGGGEEAAKAVAARDGVIPMFPPRISGRSGALIALWLLLPVVACDQGGSSPALPQHSASNRMAPLSRSNLAWAANPRLGPISSAAAIISVDRANMSFIAG